MANLTMRRENRSSTVAKCRSRGYKWRDRDPIWRQRRRLELDTAVKGFFDASEGT
jgi:hypothetical protein